MFKKGNKYAKKHGMTNTRIHNIWHSMYCRCYYQSTNGYKNYGGKGIKVCEEWKKTEGFVRFYNWAIENGYNDKLTLDRIDNDKDYCPENCRWVSYIDQENSRKNNRLIEYKGEVKTMAQWCRKYNINVVTFSDRLKREWTIEQALNISTKGMNKKI